MPAHWCELATVIHRTSPFQIPSCYISVVDKIVGHCGMPDWGWRGREGATVPSEMLEEFEIATCNMSVPVMAALLDRIHNRLQQNGELEDVAEHIGEALSLLYGKRDEVFLAALNRPN